VGLGVEHDLVEVQGLVGREEQVEILERFGQEVAVERRL
jgi:hypothetical protein